MPSIINPARQRLENGELAIGVLLRQARTVDIAKIMKTCGYDYLFIDLEHNAMSIDAAVQICVTALDVGIAPIVRVPAFDYRLATRVLDNGALGIVLPHVDTATQAGEAVDHLKYPPLGHRSIDLHSPHLDFVRTDAGDAAALNAATMLVATIESPAGVANAEAIAAVDGIDALLVGGNDLMLAMGLADQPGHDDVVAAYDAVIASCLKHGKWAGIGGVYDRDLMARYVGRGARLLLAGNDLRMLMAAATDQARFLRGCL